MSELRLSYLDEIDDARDQSIMETCLVVIESCLKELDMINNSGDYDVTAIYQEAKTDKQPMQKESTIKKLLMVIPRMIAYLIKQIKKLFGKEEPEEAEEVKSIKPGMLDKVAKMSNYKKALLAIGVTALSVGAGVVVFQIHDYSPAVEFKDDVKFYISESGELRVAFPYYKIDQIKEFNTNIDKPLAKLKSYASKTSIESVRKEIDTEMAEVFKKVYTNQALIKERDYKNISEWETFYKETCELFKAYSEKLKNVQEAFNKFDAGNKGLMEISAKTDNSEVNWIEDLSRFISKTPGDIELITKLNDKIHKVYKIITDPSASKIKKKFNQKHKFTPVISEKEMINIYAVDTTNLDKAALCFGKAFLEVQGQTKGQDLDDSKLNEKISETEPYKNALKLIEEQFNFKGDWKLTERGGSTIPRGNVDINQISFSKKKGFNLNGMTLTIYNSPMTWISMTESPKPTVVANLGVSVICHEIFHNIARKCGIIYDKFHRMIMDVLINASKPGFAIIEIVNKIWKKICGLFKMGDQAIDSKTEAYLTAYLSADSPEEANEVLQDIKDGKLAVRENKRKVTDVSVIWWQEAAVPVVYGIATIVSLYSPVLATYCGILALSTTAYSLYNNSKSLNNEEALCDMCSALYKRPVLFNYNEDNLKLAKTSDRNKSKNVSRVLDPHPVSFDRNTVSHELADEILNSTDTNIPDHVKEYLKHVKEKTEPNVRVERQFTKNEMKRMAIPKDTKSGGISQWITQFCKDHNIPVTESFVDNYLDDIIIEE